MNTGKLLLGTLAGGVVLFLLGWVVYGMLLMDYMTEHMNQCIYSPMEELNWILMIVSNLVSALLLAIIIGWSGQTGFMSGAKIGGVVGLLSAIALGLSFHAMSTLYSSLTVVIVDVLAWAVISAITGGVIGLIMGRGNNQ